MDNNNWISLLLPSFHHRFKLSVWRAAKLHACWTFHTFPLGGHHTQIRRSGRHDESNTNLILTNHSKFLADRENPAKETFLNTFLLCCHCCCYCWCWYVKNETIICKEILMMVPHARSLGCCLALCDEHNGDDVILQWILNSAPFIRRAQLSRTKIHHLQHLGEQDSIPKWSVKTGIFFVLFKTPPPSLPNQVTVPLQSPGGWTTHRKNGTKVF